jgi:hypothetical protein
MVRSNEKLSFNIVIKLSKILINILSSKDCNNNNNNTHNHNNNNNNYHNDNDMSSK